MDFYDPEGKPVVTPQKLVKNILRRRISQKSLKIEKCALICVTRQDVKAVVTMLHGTVVAAWQGYREIYQGQAGEGERNVTIAATMPAAPNCVALVEELAAFGMEQAIFLGYCGSLQPGVRPGDLIVPTEAIREEGTSFHYLPPDVAAKPNQEIQEAIVGCLQKRKVSYHQGTIWTTDAIYRETDEKVKRYQGEGVLGVEMELSALFAFGMARNVAMGGVLVVTDELSPESWRPRFFTPRVINGVRQARKVMVEAVKELA
jgi:uridine phosphorylase